MLRRIWRVEEVLEGREGFGRLRRFWRVEKVLKG